MSGSNARRILGMYLTGFVAAWSIGCSEDGPVGSTNDDQVAEMGIDLSQDDGGTGAEDEAPGFGDPYFASYLDEDEPALDPLEGDLDFRRLEGDAGADVFLVRATWGNLAASPDERDDASSAVVYDWTGGAMVSDGILIPRRVIRFERSDHLVRPDRDRQKVEWVSHTSPHWDGVLLQVVVPAAGDNTLRNARANTAGDGLTPDDTFTFSAPEMGLELTYPLADMAAIDETVMIDDAIGVTLQGFTRDDLGDACPKGPVAGAWVKVPDDSLGGGYFRAHWTNALGGLFGHVRGRWGTTAEGVQAFVGKIIGRHGEYLGHVRGTWEASAEDPNQGSFQGAWIVLNRHGDRRAMGGVRGEWAIGDDGEHGRMRGMWSKDCGKDDDGGDEDEDDGDEDGGEGDEAGA